MLDVDDLYHASGWKSHFTVAFTPHGQELPPIEDYTTRKHIFAGWE